MLAVTAMWWNYFNLKTEGNVFFLIEVIRALAEEAGELRNIAMMTLPQSVFAGWGKAYFRATLKKCT